jgi:hypothetical protein
MKKILSLWFISSMALARAEGPLVVYGEDNRREVHESSDFEQQLAHSTMAVVPVMNIYPMPDHPGYVFLSQRTLADLLKMSGKKEQSKLITETQPNSPLNFCPGTPYTDQPAAANCSAFLISQDLVVTAGHCTEIENFCENFKFVFDYKLDPLTNTAGLFIPEDSVYGCKEIVSADLYYFLGLDYGVIKLDRRVRDRAPLKISSDLTPTSTPLVVIGNPSGLPTKVTGSGKIRVNSHANSFLTDLDTFQGNSGSAVFDAKTGVVQGILVNGEEDWELNEKENCLQTKFCLDNPCRGEGVSRMRSIPEVYLKSRFSQAIKKNDLIMLRALIDRESYLDFATDDGRTALMEAVESGHELMVQMLLEAGANPNAQDAQDQTPLHLIASRLKLENSTPLELLLKYGAKLEMRDIHHQTPLALAAKALNMEAIRLLIKAGANPNVRDVNGSNILMPFLMNEKYDEVLELVKLKVDPAPVMKIIPRKVRKSIRQIIRNQRTTSKPNTGKIGAKTSP